MLVGSLGLRIARWVPKVNAYSGGVGGRADSRILAPSQGPLCHGSSQCCEVFAKFPFETILARQKCYTLRHNWLNDDHLIGRLLKPHMTGTIFINFAARHSLVKTKDSLVQQQFSVDSKSLWILSTFHAYSAQLPIIRNLTNFWLTDQFPSFIKRFLRWEGMEPCNLYLRRCRTNTSGQTWPSQRWWRREDSLKTSQMKWKTTTTGELYLSSYTLLVLRGLNVYYVSSQGRRFQAVGCIT